MVGQKQNKNFGLIFDVFERPLSQNSTNQFFATLSILLEHMECHQKIQKHGTSGSYFYLKIFKTCSRSHSKKNDVFAFFYIFSLKFHILWNIVANIKKTVRNRLKSYLHKKTVLLGNYVALWKHFYYVKKCG